MPCMVPFTVKQQEAEIFRWSLFNLHTSVLPKRLKKKKKIKGNKERRERNTIKDILRFVDRLKFSTDLDKT